MNVSDKIRFFYDKVKIRGVTVKSPGRLSLSVAIPAAALSLVIGAAVIIPNLIKKSAKRDKEPSKAV